MKKLIIIGDSVIKGVCYQSETNKYKLCSDAKYSSFQSSGFEVENKAVIGATFEKCREITDRCVSSENPDNTVILFSFGGNDSNYNWREIADNPEGIFYPATVGENLFRGYTELINKVKSRGFDVVMTNLVPIDPHKFFNTISRGLDKDNILKWLGDENMLYRWHEYYNSIVEKIAENSKCPFLDIRTPFITSHNYSSLLCDDGIHPTEEGHVLIHSTLKSCLLR